VGGSLARTDVEVRLRSTLAAVLEIADSDITPESRLVDDLDADSLDLLELVVTLREQFGISVSDGEVKALLVELARFLPRDDTVLLSLASTDDEFAELTRRLTVGTVVDFVADRVQAE
jgi:acyl carrier protein